MPQDGAYPPNNQPNRGQTANQEYVTAPHVAILKEHVLSGDGNGDMPSYCGPSELQQIANNNNKRVRQTGDATPIVLGHTTDGTPETEQPEIVGYATNFSVGPLFETGKMALFADFHVRREEKDRVNKFFPRRSVEFWPRRLEIDPISLLGATTPEQDLGLVQFSRNGHRYERVRVGNHEVIRYHRRGEAEHGYRLLFEDAPITDKSTRPRQYAKKGNENSRPCECTDRSCPCCKGKCAAGAYLMVHRTDEDDDEGTPMCEGCAADALDSGVFREGHSLARVQRKKQAPFSPPETIKKSRRTTEADMGSSVPTPYRYVQPYRFPVNGNGGGPRRYDAVSGGMGGDNPPDEATAKMVEAVLNSAPIQELVQSGQQTQSQLQEIMQLLQSQGGEGGEQGQEGGETPPEAGQGPPTAPGGEGGEEGPPDEQARWMHEGPPEQYEGDDEGAEQSNDVSQYAMDDSPEQYAEDDYVMDDDEKTAPAKRYAEGGGSYASSTNDYIPSESEQYAAGFKPRKGHMAGHHGGIHPGSKRRHSRTAAEGVQQQQPRQTKSHFEIYVESLRDGDQKRRLSRDEQEREQMRATIRELVTDKVRFARAKQLDTLQQTEGIVMDVASEVERLVEVPEEQFKTEIERIKRYYRRDPASVGLVRVTDHAPAPSGSPPPVQPDRMTHDQKIKYGRAIAESMQSIRKKNPEMSEPDLMARAKADADQRIVA